MYQVKKRRKEEDLFIRTNIYTILIAWRVWLTAFNWCPQMKNA